MVSDKKNNTDAVDLTYVEHDREPILNYDGPVRPDSQRAHRALAFHFIYAVDRSGYSTTLEDIIDGYRREFGLEIDDDAFSITMARGVIEHRDEIDAIITPVLEHWELSRLSCSTHLILQIALWEMNHTETPAAIAINEAIELAKSFAEEDAYRLVNGVLDRIEKSKTDTKSD